jgi:predicted dehydrogenase
MNEMNTGIPNLSRRSFLRTTAATVSGVGAGVLFPNLLARSVLGAAPNPVRAGIRVGCIAVGNQGGALLKRNLQNVVAVCEVDQERLAAAKAAVEKATQRSCATYTDYRKLLENKEIDAVMIASPDHWHALQTIHACQAGKDVYVEKPLSLMIEEGKLMLKAARHYNRVVQTGSMQRSDAKFRLACELVRSGRIGRVKTIRVGLPGVNFNEKTVPDSEPPAGLDYDLWLGPAPYRPYNKNRVHYNFRFFWDYSGGQMTNWGAHHLDIAQWGLGMDASGPVEIESMAMYDREKRYEVPSRFEILYKYANGVTIICGQGQKIGTTFEGDEGSIYVDRGKLSSDPAEIMKEPLGEKDVHLYVSKNHDDNWYQCIKDRKLPICDVAVGHRSATVCHLGNISVRTGQLVKWDPLREEIVDNAELRKRMSYAYREPWRLPVI